MATCLTWYTPFWLQGSCSAWAPQRQLTSDTRPQGGQSPSWQAAGQVCPQGSRAPQVPPQLNSWCPQRLSVTTEPQWQLVDTTRGQGGQGPEEAGGNNSCCGQEACVAPYCAVSDCRMPAGSSSTSAISCC